MFNASHAPLLKRSRPKNSIFVNKKFVNEGSITKFMKILCHENLELYGNTLTREGGWQTHEPSSEVTFAPLGRIHVSQADVLRVLGVFTAATMRH